MIRIISCCPACPPLIHRLFIWFHLRPNGVTTESQRLETAEWVNLLFCFFLMKVYTKWTDVQNLWLCFRFPVNLLKKACKPDGIFSPVKLNNDFVYLFDKRRFLGCELKGVHVHVCDFYQRLLIFHLSSLRIRRSGGQIRVVVTLQSGFGKISQACKQACCYLTRNKHRQR